MAYNPEIQYTGDQYIYDALKGSAKQFNNFLYGFLMPNKSTGPVAADVPNWDALNSGQGPQVMPGTAPAPGPSLADRFKAGASSAAEGFDRFKQDADESNALEKLLKVMYPDSKTQIDTMSLGEKRGMLQAGQMKIAQEQAQQTAMVRMLNAQAAVARARTAQAVADAKTGATPFTPAGGFTTIDLGDGNTLKVPYVTTSKGTAKTLDEFVPGNPKYPGRGGVTVGQPPKDVQPPTGYEWIWNGKTWVMGRQPTSKADPLTSL